MAPLAQRLLDTHRMDVVVETGGDQDISVLPPGVTRIMDIKLPGSGMSNRMDPENLRRLTPGDEVKLVISGRPDYEAARDLVRGPLAGFTGAILFSPVHGEQAADELAEWVLADRLPVRVQLQLHKLIWPLKVKGA
jgi:7-carboxy-7-deazaguanine synthase